MGQHHSSVLHFLDFFHVREIEEAFQIVKEPPNLRGHDLVADHPVQVTADAIARLRALRAESKFVEDLPAAYPGAPDERTRDRCESAINDLIDELLALGQGIETKSQVLDEFEQALFKLKREDTEEREQAGKYLERIMDVFGIESSDGMLNRWLYGFDPTNA